MLRKGDRTKTQILDAALRIASREGLAGLTIGELAKSAGLSKSGLFAHFKGKDALQLSVLGAAVDRFVATVMVPAFTKPRGQPRIEALIENWLEFIDGNAALPGGSVLISASIELDDRPGPLRDFVQETQRDLVRNIEKAARIAVEESQFRRDLDCEQFAWALYSYILGYHHFARLLDNPKAATFLWRAVNELIASARAGRTSIKKRKLNFKKQSAHRRR